MDKTEKKFIIAIVSVAILMLLMMVGGVQSNEEQWNSLTFEQKAEIVEHCNKEPRPWDC